jgi:predicted ATPase
MRGLYAKVIFPRLLELSVGGKTFARERTKTLKSVHREVLEVGFGTGDNLPHYPPSVTRLVAHGLSRFVGRDARRKKVGGKVLMLDRSLEDAIPYLFALLGIVDGIDPLAQMDGQIKKRRTLDAIKHIMLRESMRQPLMVIFEGLHWVDTETQALLNLLADSIATAKVLLLVNYRPEYPTSS